MNDDFDPTADAQLDARLRQAVSGPDDEDILRRARFRVASGLTSRGRRGFVVALAALIPAAAAAVLVGSVLGHLGRASAVHPAVEPTPSAQISAAPVIDPTASPEPAPTAPPASPSPTQSGVTGPIREISMMTEQ